MFFSRITHGTVPCVLSFGTSTATVNIGGLTLGPQTSTYEPWDMDPKKREVDEITHAEIEESVGFSAAFGIGIHASIGISFSGLFEDLLEYSTNF